MRFSSGNSGSVLLSENRGFGIREFACGSWVSNSRFCASTVGKCMKEDSAMSYMPHHTAG
jgi:hypothetical protein